uniref:Transformer-like protein A isoform F2 n=1 Tax=Ceratosolen solmsi TaxID=142686 RepID=A0A0U2U0H9_9HYME|nr:transformer-like protein A isoform F2 [Ceratosolen solmsi]
MKRRGSSDSYSDVERKKEKRRIAWMIEQEKEREHERLKRKKIEEYERKRAEQLGLSKQRSSRRSRSKSRSRSRSEESHHRSRLKSRTKRSQIMSEKRNSSDGNKSFFKGPEKPQKIDVSELKQVTVKIHRKIPAPATETNEIRRIIVNPEEITLKRREGEGTKPIFDREELKNSENPIEVEEHRTIEAVGKTNTVKRSQAKRRSLSLSPRRHRSPSPHLRLTTREHSRHSRSSEYSRYRSEDYGHKDYKVDGYDFTLISLCRLSVFPSMWIPC